MQKNKGKSVFIKADKIGEGELGSILIKGFLGAMLEQETLPTKIVCVNSAVLLTTVEENNPVLPILKELEQRGVTILSCGTCLDYYDKREDLKVGKPGNAIETIAMLLNEDVVSL
ncbi:sulfurtransferase-like selenium metabolism protein YedF [Halarcobacter ebronensis]|uniref:Sulfurtransferase-like selenium metabolism protein YedF n=1 Tax=Halarcobacter ebronensis TaxID=1462615 RepID=A0A4Q0YB98_9BACT|nr:sulfurtransferase-like selenium metabolism protein YedF [Halarcobacter ebronensis]RXJ66329.1 sulfurtransferase-like selenium metabolism protein YedF [Halarcobacter ebronensis]